MRIWPIGPTEGDLDRVLSYVTKGLEVGVDGCPWKFLDDLVPRQAA